MSKEFIAQSLAVPATYTPVANKSTQIAGILVTPASSDIYAKATDGSWVSSGFTSGADVALPSNLVVDIRGGDLASLQLKSETGKNVILFGSGVTHGMAVAGL